MIISYVVDLSTPFPKTLKSVHPIIATSNLSHSFHILSRASENLTSSISKTDRKQQKLQRSFPNSIDTCSMKQSHPLSSSPLTQTNKRADPGSKAQLNSAKRALPSIRRLKIPRPCRCKESPPIDHRAKT